MPKHYNGNGRKRIEDEQEKKVTESDRVDEDVETEKDNDNWFWFFFLSLNVKWNLIRCGVFDFSTGTIAIAKSRVEQIDRLDVKLDKSGKWIVR